MAFSARFDTKSGRFMANAKGSPKYDPSHVGEYKRSRRMQEVFYDVDTWEKQLAEEKKRKAEEESEDGGGGGKKSLTKKELAFFKERNKEKKEARKRQWLTG